jgi:hypothetical protein
MLLAKHKPSGRCYVVKKILSDRVLCHGEIIKAEFPVTTHDGEKAFLTTGKFEGSVTVKEVNPEKVFKALLLQGAEVLKQQGINPVLTKTSLKTYVRKTDEEKQEIHRKKVMGKLVKPEQVCLFDEDEKTLYGNRDD